MTEQYLSEWRMRVIVDLIDNGRLLDAQRELIRALADGFDSPERPLYGSVTVNVGPFRGPLAVSAEAACGAVTTNWVGKWSCSLPVGHHGHHYAVDRGVSVEWTRQEKRP